MRYFIISISTVLTLSTCLAKSSAGKRSISLEKEYETSKIVVKAKVVKLERKRYYDGELLKLFPQDSAKFDDFPFCLSVNRYTAIANNYYKSDWDNDTVFIYDITGRQPVLGKVLEGETYIFLGMHYPFIDPFGKYEFLPYGQGNIWLRRISMSRQCTDSVEQIINKLR